MASLKGNPSDSHSNVSVLLIGAGASGISVGYQLKKKMGFTDFRIVERQAGVRGT